MQRTPFNFVFEAGRGFRRPASSRNPAVRAAMLAGATVVFLALLILMIPLLALFVVLFLVFWAVGSVAALFTSSKDKASPRENVRVVPPAGDHSAGV